MSSQEASQRFRQTIELMDLGFALMRENLKRRFPKATKAELDQKFSDWLCSRPPMSGTDLRVTTGKRAARRFLKRQKSSPTNSSSNRQSKRT